MLIEQCRLKSDPGSWFSLGSARDIETPVVKLDYTGWTCIHRSIGTPPTLVQRSEARRASDATGIQEDSVKANGSIGAMEA